MPLSIRRSWWSPHHTIRHIQFDESPARWSSFHIGAVSSPQISFSPLLRRLLKLDHQASICLRLHTELWKGLIVPSGPLKELFLFHPPLFDHLLPGSGNQLSGMMTWQHVHIFPNHTFFQKECFFGWCLKKQSALAKHRQSGPQPSRFLSNRVFIWGWLPEDHFFLNQLSQ